MKKLVNRDDIALFFAGWKFPDYFIYGLTVFVSLVIGYVAGAN